MRLLEGQEIPVRVGSAAPNKYLLCECRCPCHFPIDDNGIQLGNGCANINPMTVDTTSLTICVDCACNCED